MPEELPKTLISAQAAMLAVMGATAILATPTASEKQLEEASAEVESWNVNPRLDLPPQPDPHGWLFDVPSRPALDWIDVHTADGPSKRRPVYGRGYGVDVAGARTLADLCVLAGVTCKAEDWKVVRIVAEHSERDAIAAVLGARRQTETAKDQVDKDNQDLAQKTTAYLLAVAQNGAPAAATALGEKNKARDKRDADHVALNQAQGQLKTSQDRMVALSSSIRDLAATPGGTSIVLANDPAGFYAVAELPDPELGKAGSCNTPAPKGCRLDGSLRDCVATCDHHLFDASLDVLTRTGVWKELHDVDVRSAQARLADMIGSAELEGEVLGLKVHSKDARRWAWLPVLALLTYSWHLGLMKRFPAKKGADEEDADEKERHQKKKDKTKGDGQPEDPLWTRWPAQLAIAAGAFTTISYSMDYGLHVVPTEVYPLIAKTVPAGVALLLVADAILLFRARQAKGQVGSAPPAAKPAPAAAGPEEKEEEARDELQGNGD